MAELSRWNTIFSDPSTDPKTVLIQQLKYTREQAKAALNQTINGSKQYGKFVKWFKTKFPLLHGVWTRTRSATVGNEISAFYETNLMKDMELYQMAERLGLHLTYEYDGCGVMCRDDDRKAITKIQQLISHVQAKSVKMWGIRPIIVVKTPAGEGKIDLNTGDGKPLKGPSDVGTGQEDEKIKLSELIDILNERFGTDFTQADQLFFDQIQEEAIQNDLLKAAAAANTKEDFRYVFEKAFEGLVIDRMDGNEEIFGKLMSDAEFRKLAVEHLLKRVYDQLKKPADNTNASAPLV
jgi:hypothetical protein